MTWLIAWHTKRRSGQKQPLLQKLGEVGCSETRHRVPALARVESRRAAAGVSTVSNIFESIRKVGGIDLPSRHQLGRRRKGKRHPRQGL